MLRSGPVKEVVGALTADGATLILVYLKAFTIT